MAKIALLEARPPLRLKNKGGAPRGNRNAFKTGLHTAELRDLRRRLAAFHRRARAAIAYADKVIEERKRLAREAAEAAAAPAHPPPHPLNALTASESEAGPLAPLRP